MKLKKHSLENINVINNIESFLIKKRGYVFKMPKPGSSVSVSFSGGLDSTVMLDILLSKFGFTVYPFYIADQPRSRIEIRKAQNLIKYFQLRYPDKVKSLVIFNNSMVGDWAYRLTELDFTNRNLVNIVIDLRQHFSLLHTQYIRQVYQVKLNTMFCGIQYHDGNFNPAQTLTGLRTTHFNMCVKTNQYDWQFTSIFLEKELGLMLEKPDLIKIGNKMKLPLELTWSCFRSGTFHCGKCGNCYVRKDSFYKAGVKDKTLYGSVGQFLAHRMIFALKKIKRKIYNIVSPE